MTEALIEIDAMLIGSLGLDNESYQETKDSMQNSVNKISEILGVKDNTDVMSFATGFFKMKKKVAPIEDLKCYVESVADYSDHILSFLPLLLTINTVDFISTKDEITHLFASLCKKAIFASADLGDEGNEGFIRACVKVMDYCFFEELEANGIPITSRNINFSDVITDAFKNSLWERIDEKVELLKHLKKEVFSDDDLLWTKGVAGVSVVKSAGKEKSTIIPENAA